MRRLIGSSHSFQLRGTCGFPANLLLRNLVKATFISGLFLMPTDICYFCRGRTRERSSSSSGSGSLPDSTDPGSDLSKWIFFSSRAHRFRRRFWETLPQFPVDSFLVGLRQVRANVETRRRSKNVASVTSSASTFRQRLSDPSGWQTVPNIFRPVQFGFKKRRRTNSRK